jgi:hypothetical protein
MPAVIERDRAPASAGERRDPTGMYPIHLLVGGEAVHQHNWLALALVEINDLDLAIPETWHGAF